MNEKLPAIILITVLVIGALISVIYNPFTLYFMSAVLGLLSILKLTDLKGFAHAFAKYDIIAKRSRTYALTYPFIELTLAILFFAGIAVRIAASALIVIMAVGLVGVVKHQKKGIRCACMGTKINVPLTTLTISENSIMILMALMVLL